MLPGRRGAYLPSAVLRAVARISCRLGPGRRVTPPRASAGPPMIAPTTSRRPVSSGSHGRRYSPDAALAEAGPRSAAAPRPRGRSPAASAARAPARWRSPFRLAHHRGGRPATTARAARLDHDLQARHLLAVRIEAQRARAVNQDAVQLVRDRDLRADQNHQPRRESPQQEDRYRRHARLQRARPRHADLQARERPQHDREQRRALSAPPTTAERKRCAPAPPTCRRSRAPGTSSASADDVAERRLQQRDLSASHEIQRATLAPRGQPREHAQHAPTRPAARAAARAARDTRASAGSAAADRARPRSCRARLDVNDLADHAVEQRRQARRVPSGAVPARRRRSGCRAPPRAAARSRRRS